MEKKFETIELEIDWEGPGLAAPRSIPRAPAVPNSVPSEAEPAESDRVCAPADAANPAPAPAYHPADTRSSASAHASGDPEAVRTQLESGAAAADEPKAEVAELEALEELEEVEELDDSFLEPVDGPPGSSSGQSDSGK
jgi:hypothetical protein